MAKKPLKIVKGEPPKRPAPEEQIRALDLEIRALIAGINSNGQRRPTEARHTPGPRRLVNNHGGDPDRTPAA